MRDDKGHITYNIKTKSCACRVWDLTGISCIHALQCLLNARSNPVDVVDSYYSKVMYLKSYAGNISPSPDSIFWLVTGDEKVLHPPYKKRPGRQKKKRRISTHEMQNSNQKRRFGKTSRCSNCQQSGHNSRKCINEIVEVIINITGIRMDFVCSVILRI